MNIDLDGVAILDVTDDALELAAGGAKGEESCRTAFDICA